MAKQPTKAKSGGKKVKVNNLSKSEKKLSAKEMKKVKGGDAALRKGYNVSG